MWGEMWNFPLVALLLVSKEFQILELKIRETGIYNIMWITVSNNFRNGNQSLMWGHSHPPDCLFAPSLAQKWATLLIIVCGLGIGPKSCESNFILKCCWKCSCAFQCDATWRSSYWKRQRESWEEAAAASLPTHAGNSGEPIIRSLHLCLCVVML